MKSRASLVKVPTVSFTKLDIRRQGKSVSYLEIKVAAGFLNLFGRQRCDWIGFEKLR